MMKTTRPMPRTAVLSALFFLLVTLWLGCTPPTRPDGGEGLLPVGASAPDLVGQDQNGGVQRISAEKGHPLVVYFYPKDGTPGCTTQACAFRDSWAKYQAAGVKIFGVSADTRESHAEFATEHSLPFPLVADPTFTWANAFGVGSKLGMMERVTFLIDAAGKVANVYPDVDPAVNATQILGDVAALASRGAAPAPEAMSASAPPASPAAPPAAPASAAAAPAAAPPAAASAPATPAAAAPAAKP